MPYLDKINNAINVLIIIIFFCVCVLLVFHIEYITEAVA